VGEWALCCLFSTGRLDEEHVASILLCIVDYNGDRIEGRNHSLKPSEGGGCAGGSCVQENYDPSAVWAAVCASPLIRGITKDYHTHVSALFQRKRRSIVGMSPDGGHEDSAALLERYCSTSSSLISFLSTIRFRESSFTQAIINDSNRMDGIRERGITSIWKGTRTAL